MDASSTRLRTAKAKKTNTSSQNYVSLKYPKYDETAANERAAGQISSSHTQNSNHALYYAKTKQPEGKLVIETSPHTQKKNTTRLDTSITNGTAVNKREAGQISSSHTQSSNDTLYNT